MVEINSANMRRYFVTGGTGFIGRALVAQILLLPDTELVVCLTRGHRNNLLSHPQLRYEIGDITEVKFPLYQGFTDVIHGANEANDLLQPDQHKYYYTIVEGTERLMKWAPANCQRILVISSGAVARDTILGRAKRQQERIASGKAKIARIFAVIGNEAPLNGQYAVGRFVGGALDGAVKFYGGSSVRSYIHIEDCARWLIKILNKGGIGYPYEVSGNEPVTMWELAKRIAAAFDVPLQKIDGPDREDIYLPDTMASYRLGLRQTISLDESIRRMRDYHLHYPDVEQAT